MENFKIGQKLTLVTINSMALTIKSEIELIDYNGLFFVFKYKKKGERYLLKLGKTDLVFEGWNLPIIADTETNYYRGNACLNFLSESPEQLRGYIEKNNLNPYFCRKGIVIYIDANNEEHLLYPEEVEQHAVIQRMKEKMK